MMAARWNLVADIGGTNARFAVADTTSSRLLAIKQYSVAEHPTFLDAVTHFLKDVAGDSQYQPLPEAACLALACPITGDQIQLTNNAWRVDRLEIGALLDHKPVQLINDFAAVGYAISSLQPQDWVEVCPGDADPNSPVIVLGPGTGLGVCAVAPLKLGFRVLSGEGGHVDFSPVEAIEIEILKQLSSHYDRVSAERILSGAGLENIYRALTTIHQRPCPQLSAADIAAAAVAGTDSLAEEALEIFCRCLGSVAGNLALTLGARGGVYIAGGIVPRFLDTFLSSGFKDRYLAKGRFRHYLEAIPVRLIIKDNPGLAGAATKLTLLET